jgi:VanZ family protein
MLRRLPELFFVAFAGFIIFVIIQVNSGRGVPWIGGIGNLPHFDKAGHLLLMGGLSFLAVLAIVPRIKSPPKKATIRVVSILILIIAIEEISQSFIPSRTLSLADFFFGVVGATLCGCLAYRLALIFSKTR